jgi:hypothetical protein
VEERAERIRAAGYQVDGEVPSGRAYLRALQEDPPLAVVIDLGRLPSQGRDMGLQIRNQGATRHVPLVFVEGDPQKVARVHELLPDAVYCSWPEIGEALGGAIAAPPDDPVVPGSVFAAYAGTPLPKKLGIQAGHRVALVEAPAGFEKTLGELPVGVELARGARVPCDLTIWFTHSREKLEAGLAGMIAQAGQGPVWIAWPKKASGVATDLSQQVVRETGLGAGLVDYKICSIDATWSGLLFTRRT